MFDATFFVAVSFFLKSPDLQFSYESQILNEVIRFIIELSGDVPESQKTILLTHLFFGKTIDSKTIFF